jgi:hypothetical protein
MLQLQLCQRILEIYPRTLLRSTTSCWPFWELSSTLELTRLRGGSKV